nr:MAG: hypothetical protein EDM05_27340 [Leptolyngbya sp. IPPAS B-1204]
MVTEQYSELNSDQYSALRKGVQLILSPDLEGQTQRIWISSGLTPAATMSGHRSYALNAFIPQPPWRLPNSAEYQLLCADNSQANLLGWQLGSSIGVCRIPDPVLTPLITVLEKLELATLSRQHFLERLRSPENKQAILPISQFLHRYFLFPHQPKLLGFYLKQPGLETSTATLAQLRPSGQAIDPDQVVYVGMHLDSWEVAPIERRHRSRNRLCINLGREDRFFLFINLTLKDLSDALDPLEVKNDPNGVRLGELFMQRYPSYPVVKLKVAPGEAYIAPTDNLIHDASSIDKQQIDLTMTLLGYFGLPFVMN